MRAVKLPLLEKKSENRDEKKRAPEAPAGDLRTASGNASQKSGSLSSSPVFEESLLSELLQKEPIRRADQAPAHAADRRPSPLFRVLTSAACLFSLLLLAGSVLLTSHYLMGNGLLEVFLDGVSVGYAESNADVLGAVRLFEEDMSVRLGSGITFDGELTYRLAAGKHTPTTGEEWQKILFASVEEDYSFGTALLLDGKQVGILADEEAARNVLDRITAEKNTLLAGENERIELCNTVSYEQVLCKKDQLLTETALCLLLTEGDESLADFRNSLLVPSLSPSSSAADSSPALDTAAGSVGNFTSEKIEATQNGENASHISNYPIGGGFNVVYGPSGVPSAGSDSAAKPASPSEREELSDKSDKSDKNGLSSADAAETVHENTLPLPLTDTNSLPAPRPGSTPEAPAGEKKDPAAKEPDAGEEKPSSAFGKLLKYQTVIVGEEVVTESCKTVYLPTENLYEGQSELYQAGLDGLRRDQIEIASADGKLLSKTVLSSEYLLEPRDEIILVGRKPCAATGIFLWPHRGLITSGFGGREIFGEQSNHTGLDIDGKTGDVIVAADGGVVSFAGWHDSYGYLTVIDHENGYETYYAHQSEQLVSQGDRVYQGQRIGLVGETGRAAGSHLHFELRKNGVVIDPIPLLRAGESVTAVTDNENDD